MEKILRLLVGIVILVVIAIKDPPLTTQIVILIVLSGCLIITAYIKDVSDDVKTKVR